MSDIINYGNSGTISTPIIDPYEFAKSGTVDKASFSDTVNNWFTGDLNYARQKEINSINNDFNAREAAKGRAFSKYMAENAYQMQANDLKKAGFNPALVLGGGGASASNSNVATASSSAPQSNNGAANLTSFVTTALLIARIGKALL